MEERDLKILFVVGGLRLPKIVPAKDGYILQVERKDEKKYTVVKLMKRPRVSAQKNEDNTRIFKSIGAAALMAKEIGFKKVEIDFSSI